MQPPANPVRYDPSLEHAAPDEEKTNAELREQLHTILETTSKDYGHAVRSVHAKGHGLLDGTFEVLDGLPPELAQGLFAKPGRFAAVLRISTNPGDILDDSISVPRGAALKIVDANGPGRSQDFVMANGPAFAAPDPQHFLSNLKLLVKTTDRVEGFKKALSAVLQTAEAGLEKVGLSSALVKNLGGTPNSHPLGQTYYSQVPFRYGPYVAKFSLEPVSPNLVARKDDVVNAHDRPDALREDVAEGIVEGPSVWNLRAQLCTDPKAMPIEDASAIWDEKQSPFIPVARLTVEPQESWSDPASTQREDSLAFSVWNCLDDHRPIGAINRARKDAYPMSAEFRSRFNGCPIHEPTGAAA